MITDIKLQGFSGIKHLGSQMSYFSEGFLLNSLCSSSDSGPLRIAKTPSPPEEPSPLPSPTASPNHTLAPASPAPVRPRSPSQVGHVYWGHGRTHGEVIFFGIILWWPGIRKCFSGKTKVWNGRHYYYCSGMSLVFYLIFTLSSILSVWVLWTFLPIPSFLDQNVFISTFS